MTLVRTGSTNVQTYDVSDQGTVIAMLGLERNTTTAYHLFEFMGLITTKRAAELLGVTSIRVRQLIAVGQLKSEKVGRDHLLDEAEIVRFDREARRPTGRPKKEIAEKDLR